MSVVYPPHLDSRALLDAVERATLVGLAAVDEAGVQTFVNAAFCKMVGFTADELIGTKPPFPYWPAEELGAIGDAFEATVRGDAPAGGFELRFVRKSGERFWVQLLLAPLLDADGSRVGFLASAHDVTDRVERAAAEASRARLEAILDAVPVGIMIAEAPSGRVLLANVEATRIFRGPVESPPDQGDYAGVFTAWDERGRPLASTDYPLVRAVNGERVDGEVIAFLDAAGGRRYVRASAAPISAPGGATVAAVTAYVDITSARALEEAWRWSERRFRTLAEATSDIVWTTDASGLVLDSPSWCRFTGLTLEVCRTPAAWDTLHPDDRGRVQQAWAQALGDRAPFEVEYRLRRNDGVWVPMVARGAPVCGDDGTIQEWVGYNVDVSERQAKDEERARLLSSEQAARKEADEARRRAELLDAATAALLEDLEAPGVEKVARIVVPAIADWCAVFVMSPTGAIDVVALAHEDERLAELAREHLRAAPLDPALPWGVPAVIRTGTAELLGQVGDELVTEGALPPEGLATLRAAGIVAHLAVPLRLKGRVLGALTLAQTGSGRSLDAADLRFAQELALRAALSLEHARLYSETVSAGRAAEAANEAKDVFLAMLGHELRNPLAPIVTALALLRARGETGGRELAIIERQTQHMSRLVEDLLDVSRIARGEVELRREHVDIAATIDRGLEMTSPLLERGRHVLVRDVPAGLTVHGDPARLAQVFTNLLTNAARYSPAASKIQVVARRDDAAVSIRIIDEGRGIPPELLPRIFDPFVQGSQSLDRARGGLGLGLAIVQNLVTLHGGSVRAASAGTDRGTEITISLPLATRNASVPPQAPAAGGHPVGATRRVLVVDDNQDSAEMLAEFLRALGHEVEQVHDGPSAVTAFEAFSPDVIVLDIGLPGLDGYEVARRIRARGRPVRLIAATGYGEGVDRERAHEAGFDAHLAKPVDLRALESLVGESRRT